MDRKIIEILIIKNPTIRLDFLFHIIVVEVSEITFVIKEPNR